MAYAVMRRRGAKPGVAASASLPASSEKLKGPSLDEMAEKVHAIAQLAPDVPFERLSSTVAMTSWSIDDNELTFLQDARGLQAESPNNSKRIPSLYRRMTPLRSPKLDQQPQEQLNLQERQPSHRLLEDFSLRYHVTIVFKQTLALLRFLLLGTSAWILKFLRLVTFVVALLPAFVVFVSFYFITSDRIALPYIAGRKCTSRHYLDVYGSTTTVTSVMKDDSGDMEAQPLKPVVLFLTGGAWIIGYKMWGTLLARTLVPFGILVVIPDYRNFPQCNVQSMIDDADQAVEWTLNNIQQYGGDPNKLVICGQSAGAHIGACLLLQKAQKEAYTTSTPRDSTMSLDSVASDSSSWEEIPPASPALGETDTVWHAEDIKGFIGVSGPYDLVAMKDILHQHGLDKSIVSAMFGNDLQKFSPTRIVGGLQTEDKLRLQQQFPPTCIIHGQVDKTVPFKISLEFFQALQRIDLSTVQFKLYPSWSHTDPILEAPFAGNHLFHRDVYDLVKSWTISSNGADTFFRKGAEENATTTTEILLPFDETHPACRQICPLFLVQIARSCNPF